MTWVVSQQEGNLVKERWRFSWCGCSCVFMFVTVCFTLLCFSKMRALTVLYRWLSLGDASVKTKISDRGGLWIRASWNRDTHIMAPLWICKETLLFIYITIHQIPLMMLEKFWSSVSIDLPEQQRDTSLVHLLHQEPLNSPWTAGIHWGHLSPKQDLQLKMTTFI